MAEVGDAHGHNVPTLEESVMRVRARPTTGIRSEAPARWPAGRSPTGHVWPPTLRGMPNIDAHNGVAS